MWGVLIGALGSLVKWALGASTIKWAFSAVLFFGFSLLIGVILGLLPAWFSGEGLASHSSVFTPEVWYFIDYFLIEEGIALVLSAYSVRFIIRRLPFVG